MKAYDNKLKLLARKYRRSGLSYLAIAKKLMIAKSTAKSWCSDIELKPEQKKKLYSNRIKKLISGEFSSHTRRQVQIDEITAEAEKEIVSPISDDAYRFLGVALYWAEGSKTKHFSLVNSDPIMIKFMVNWMKAFLGVEPDMIKAHLNIYEGQDDKKLKAYWSKLTGIPLKNFGKSFIKPAGKNYRRNILYHGTIKIRVFSATDLRYRVLAWLNKMLSEFKLGIDEKIVWNEHKKK